MASNSVVVSHGVTLLPTGWDLPESLPEGVTVVPSDDPRAAAHALAERFGAEVVGDVTGAERALASQAARRRAQRTVAEADVATLLSSMLEGSDPEADRALLASAPLLAELVDATERAGGMDELASLDEDAVRDAARWLEEARAAAEVAAAAVGDRPGVVGSEIELLRARSIAGHADEEAARAVDATKGSGSRVGGSLAVVAGAALVLAGSSVLPIEALTAVPVGGLALTGAHERRLRRAAARAARRAEEASAEVRHVQDGVARLHAAEIDWAKRAVAAEHAAAALEEASTVWEGLGGGDTDASTVEARCAEIARARAAVARFEEARAAVDGIGLVQARALMAEVPGASDREELRRHLHDVLHGRRLDRLQADAHAARMLLDTPARVIVLCDPFASIGPGRRRALLRDLERADDVTVAVVTSDVEALAWARAHQRATAAR